MNAFPLAVQTTYQDLLEAHKMRAVPAIGGAPLLKHQGTQGNYWYARQRIGDRVVDRYIGRDTPELRKRVEAAEKQREDQRTLAKRNARLVAQLRAAGLPALDRQTGKVLNAMAQVGMFRLGGTLIGTHAFRLYSAELGVSLTDTLAVTEDVDIAAFEGLKLVIRDQVNPSLADTFRDLKLSPASTGETDPPDGRCPEAEPRWNSLRQKRARLTMSSCCNLWASTPKRSAS